MPTIPARDNEKFAKRPKVGASGGGAPEGYGITQLVTGPTIVEGLATRGPEGDKKRFEEAEKFMNSVKKADESAKVAEKKEEAKAKEEDAKAAAKDDKDKK